MIGSTGHWFPYDDPIRNMAVSFLVGVVCTTLAIHFKRQNPWAWFLLTLVSLPLMVVAMVLAPTVFMLALLLPLVPAVLVATTPRPPYPKGYCRKCGYNLRGNTSGVCPECGTPLADGRGKP